MDVLLQLFASPAGMWGLFISSVLGATLLPGGSELVLIGVLKTQPDSFWLAIFIGTLGNTLGGMISFGMGWLLPQAPKTRNLDFLQRHGSATLLLAWAPIIGDALCVSAGWLRLNIGAVIVFMAAGKFARYALIALTLQ